VLLRILFSSSRSLPLDRESSSCFIPSSNFLFECKDSSFEFSNFLCRPTFSSFSASVSFFKFITSAPIFLIRSSWYPHFVDISSFSPTLFRISLSILSRSVLITSSQSCSLSCISSSFSLDAWRSSSFSASYNMTWSFSSTISSFATVFSCRFSSSLCILSVFFFSASWKSALLLDIQSSGTEYPADSLRRLTRRSSLDKLLSRISSEISMECLRGRTRSFIEFSNRLMPLNIFLGQWCGGVFSIESSRSGWGIPAPPA